MLHKYLITIYLHYINFWGRSDFFIFLGFRPGKEFPGTGGIRQKLPNTLVQDGCATAKQRGISWKRILHCEIEAGPKDFLTRNELVSSVPRPAARDFAG
jgi:hypothetical protein